MVRVCVVFLLALPSGRERGGAGVTIATSDVVAHAGVLVAVAGGAAWSHGPGDARPPGGTGVTGSARLPGAARTTHTWRTWGGGGVGGEGRGEG